MIRRLLVTLAAVAAASALAAAPAAAVYLTPPEETIVVDSGVVAPGESVEVVGEGFAAGAEVSLEVADADGDVYLTDRGVVDSSGTVSFDVAPTRAGENTITLAGAGADGQPLVLSTSVSVQQAGTAARAVTDTRAVTDAERLAATGTSLTMLWIALGLLALGAAAFGLTKVAARKG